MDDMENGMSILISPIRAVLDQLDDQRVGYILCTSSERLKDLKQKQNVLVLRFMDVTDGSHQGAFQREQAEAIGQFLLCACYFEDLFICCDSGTSRSAAIAAAIQLWQDRSDLYIWRDLEYRPNPYVFKLQCEALGVDLCDDEILMRVDLNKAALPNATQNRYKDHPPHIPSSEDIVKIYSRKELERILQAGPLKDTAIIRFYDPSAGENAVSPDDHAGAAERVFQVPLDDFQTDLPKADNLALFIREAVWKGLNIICQCRSGQSRSAGCAAAILEFYYKMGQSIFNDDRYHPDEMVYYSVLNALETQEEAMPSTQTRNGLERINDAK